MQHRETKQNETIPTRRAAIHSLDHTNTYTHMQARTALLTKPLPPASLHPCLSPLLLLSSFSPPSLLLLSSSSSSSSSSRSTHLYDESKGLRGEGVFHLVHVALAAREGPLARLQSGLHDLCREHHIRYTTKPLVQQHPGEPSSQAILSPITSHHISSYQVASQPLPFRRKYRGLKWNKMSCQCSQGSRECTSPPARACPPPAAPPSSSSSSSPYWSTPEGSAGPMLMAHLKELAGTVICK